MGLFVSMLDQISDGVGRAQVLAVWPAANWWAIDSVRG